MKKKNTENLDSFLEKTVKLLDPKIKEVLDVDIDKKFWKIINYQIETGGKRHIPALTILSCLCCGGTKTEALYPAAGIEILHNLTLILDDIIDDSVLRRGKPTVWAKYGQSIALCITASYGSALLQAANCSSDPKKISELYAGALKKVMIEGEIMDILFEQSGRENEKYVIENRYKKVTLPDYLDMAGKKTGVLFQAENPKDLASLNALINNTSIVSFVGYAVSIARL